MIESPQSDEIHKLIEFFGVLSFEHADDDSDSDRDDNKIVVNYSIHHLQQEANLQARLAGNHHTTKYQLVIESLN